MKVREIAERLAPLFNTDEFVANRQRYTTTLLGVPLEKIAAALGVEVEPDDPELPDRLWATVGHFELGGGWIMREVHGGSAEDAASDSGRRFAAIVARNRRSIGELVEAYNARRLKWCPGVPQFSGWFAVKLTNGEVVAAYRSQPAYDGEVETRPAQWDRSLPIVAWQPLPE